MSDKQYLKKIQLKNQKKNIPQERVYFELNPICDMLIFLNQGSTTYILFYMIRFLITLIGLHSKLQALELFNIFFETFKSKFFTITFQQSNLVRDKKQIRKIVKLGSYNIRIILHQDNIQQDYDIVTYIDYFSILFCQFFEPFYSKIMNFMFRNPEKILNHAKIISFDCIQILTFIYNHPTI